MLKKTILTIIALILVFGLGMLAGTKMKPKSAIVPANQADTYQAGWDAAKKRLAEVGAMGIPADMEIKSLSGTVQAVSGNTITVKTVSAIDPLADPSLDTRTVQVNGDTKLYEFVQKDPAQFQQEMADFQKKMQAQTNSKDATVQLPTPPAMQDRKEVALSDIQEGQLVTVMSNDNIRSAGQFAASEIDIQFTLPAPAPAAQVPAENPAQ